MSCQAFAPGGFLKVEPPVRVLTGWVEDARLGDRVHLGEDRAAIAGAALETAPAVKITSSGTPQCR